MKKFSLPVVAAVVRAAAQMVVRRRGRAPGRRARRIRRTVGHVAARPLEDRVDAGRCDGVEGARVDAGVWVTRDEQGQMGGRALELCLVAKRCLEHHRVRSTMQDTMPAIVALALAHK